MSVFYSSKHGFFHIISADATLSERYLLLPGTQISKLASLIKEKVQNVI